MTSAQAWAIVVAVLAAGLDGLGALVLAVLALGFLLVDDRDRRRHESEGGSR